MHRAVRVFAQAPSFLRPSFIKKGRPSILATEEKLTEEQRSVVHLSALLQVLTKEGAVKVAS